MQGCDSSFSRVWLEHLLCWSTGIMLKWRIAFQGVWDYEGVLLSLNGSEMTFADVLV